ncbi:hypothetical protein XBKQ1_510009 [Xenorhabdus bovienii str. kraussei Quebec]|uniref:Uncharacterized protein n=1 Tax=Xenorhabdus bovienii str. kraussei Quebec TaxID=1398203 RepID=A0A077PNX3_XENBV|nr:hypothetical protein XBKQ1_510009 [Xenorhabdus bovienii str. kraussei Quebec]
MLNFNTERRIKGVFLLFYILHLSNYSFVGYKLKSIGYRN